MKRRRTKPVDVPPDTIIRRLEEKLASRTRERTEQASRREPTHRMRVAIDALHDAATFRVAAPASECVALAAFAELWAPAWRNTARAMLAVPLRDLSSFALPVGEGVELAACLLVRLLADPSDRSFGRSLGETLQSLMQLSDDPGITWNESVRGTREIFWILADQLSARLTAEPHDPTASAPDRSLRDDTLTTNQGFDSDALEAHIPASVGPSRYRRSPAKRGWIYTRDAAEKYSVPLTTLHDLARDRVAEEDKHRDDESRQFQLREEALVAVLKSRKLGMFK